ncbi:bacitracin ABC transporter ATP-binding protein, partial [Bacillus cereus]|nr:bacitracin ABC transporter ATP-binding protein [Bacillus cereus]
KELHRGELTRKQFFQQVIDVMSSISEDKADDLI